MCRFLLLLLVFPSILCAEENWPAWRGPTGDGQTKERELPLTWGGKQQDNIRWKAALFPSDKVRRDHNQSSPILWGNRVFVTVSFWPEGVSETVLPEHHLICFQLSDGKQLWDLLIPPGPWLLTDLRGGYTASTPACDGTHVYCIFGSAVIAAVSLEGKLVWRQEIKPHNFDVCLGASPVLYKGSVIFVSDQNKDKKSSSVICWDAKTGEQRWKKDRNYDKGHSTPALAVVNGKMQLIAGGANGLQAFDPETGDTIWTFPMPGRICDTVTPLVRDGQMYVDSGRGGPGVAVDVTGKGDVSETHLKWKIKLVPEGFSSPLLIGDQIYRLHSPGMLSSWNWKTGEEVFKERLEGIATGPSPIATPEGRIYCATAGRSYVLKVGPKMEILAVNELGDPHHSSPAVGPGCLLLKGGKHLFCIGKK
jgi:outer membrane protein assembly factor BamB